MPICNNLLTLCMRAEATRSVPSDIVNSLHALLGKQNWSVAL